MCSVFSFDFWNSARYLEFHCNWTQCIRIFSCLFSYNFISIPFAHANVRLILVAHEKLVFNIFFIFRLHFAGPTFIHTINGSYPCYFFCCFFFLKHWHSIKTFHEFMVVFMPFTFFMTFDRLQFNFSTWKFSKIFNAGITIFNGIEITFLIFFYHIRVVRFSILVCSYHNNYWC